MGIKTVKCWVTILKPLLHFAEKNCFEQFQHNECADNFNSNSNDISLNNASV